MNYIAMTTDADVEAGYPEIRSRFYNAGPHWPTKMREFIKGSGVPAYRISVYAEDPETDDLEYLGTADEFPGE